MVKSLNSMTLYNLSEETEPRGTDSSGLASGPLKCTWQASMERTLPGPLVHAHHCPREKESRGVMNTEGCRACCTLPHQTPRKPREQGWAGMGSLTSTEEHAGGTAPVDEHHNNNKKGKGGTFSELGSHRLQAKCHCSLLVLNCHCELVDERE